MSTTLMLVLFFLLFVWLLVITFLFIRMRKQYMVFIGNHEAKTLPSFLEEVITSIKSDRRALREIMKRIEVVEKESKVHIQKIGLVRFNPFHDTGGDQSFVLSFVDEHNNGVVISALYSRSSTRWYAKRVVSGKGEEHELTAEEEKAIRLAKTVKNS